MVKKIAIIGNIGIGRTTSDLIDLGRKVIVVQNIKDTPSGQLIIPQSTTFEIKNCHIPIVDESIIKTPNRSQRRKNKRKKL